MSFTAGRRIMKGSKRPQKPTLSRRVEQLESSMAGVKDSLREMGACNLAINLRLDQIQQRQETMVNEITTAVVSGINEELKALRISLPRRERVGIF